MFIKMLDCLKRDNNIDGSVIHWQRASVALQVTQIGSVISGRGVGHGLGREFNAGGRTSYLCKQCCAISLTCGHIKDIESPA